ncbi:MAG: prolipoprotein diacylglyceryl transferase [Rhodoglobus sp.]
MSLVPLSIPSPPLDWQVPLIIPVGQWLHGFVDAVPANLSIAVHSYALCILLGIIAATFLVDRRLIRRGAEPGVVLDVIVWAIPFGLVGARVYHVLTHPGDYFFEGADPWEVIRIWNGGIAIFGSLIGGAIGAWIGCRVVGLRFWTFADALAPAMLLAQVFGRLGNYVNHELYGRPTDLPWGLHIESTNAAFPVGLAEGTLFHPTFLYEMIWNVIGIMVLLSVERRFRAGVTRGTGSRVGEAARGLQWGKLWALYMIWYGIGRAWLESIRVDPSEVFWGIRTNIWGAIIAVVLGLMLFWWQSRRHPGVEPGPYNRGREWKPQGAIE